MADGLRAVVGWLDAVEARAPTDGAVAIRRLGAEVAGADGGDGLPEGFVHPDPRPQERHIHRRRTGASRLDIHRSWTPTGIYDAGVAFGVGGGAVYEGYARQICLEEAERERLAGLLFRRALIGACIRVCLDPGIALAATKKPTSLRRESETSTRPAYRGHARVAADPAIWATSPPDLYADYMGHPFRLQKPIRRVQT
jgi:hypothetical protein